MQKRVTALRRFMLPSKFSEIGLYSERVHQRTAAFRLLVHAEFESYLEEAVVTHVAARVRDWKVNGQPSITLASLLAYDEGVKQGPDSMLNPPQRLKSFNDRLDDAVARFNRYVRVNNHGVREMNVLRMVLPIGVAPASLDVTWLADLDGWASERGDLAHQSSGKMKMQLDPAREYAKVKKLLAGFRNLDRVISGLR